jgi:hypothetical protein
MRSGLILDIQAENLNPEKSRRRRGPTGGARNALVHYLTLIPATLITFAQRGGTLEISSGRRLSIRLGTRVQVRIVRDMSSWWT